MMQSIMQRTNLTNRKYGLLILAAVLSISLIFGISGWVNDRLIRNAIQGDDSPVATPWEWFGVACRSDVQLTGVPFSIKIMHAPGKSRDVVDDAVQQMPSQNGTKDGIPYSAENLQTYLITKTHCFDSWQEIYDSWNWTTRGRLDVLLPANRAPAEADYRAAILQVAFPDEFEAANRIFPIEAEMHSTVERWE